MDSGGSAFDGHEYRMDHAQDRAEVVGRSAMTDAESQAFMASQRASFSVACVIIAGTGHRQELIDFTILPKAAEVGFDDILVVGTHHAGEGYRYIPVPDLTKTTNDALVKRDVGALATTCDVLWYLSDDHYPSIGTLSWLKPDASWDVIVPCRWTMRPGLKDEPTRIPLNNGEVEGYCGGHGMIVKRRIIQAHPWCEGPFDRCWDLLISQRQQAQGAKFVYKVAGIDIYDVEPNSEPWK